MNKPLILIVEDDKAVRNLMGTTLDMQEYRYHMAKNGAQALMEAVSQRPDVIILDLGLSAWKSCWQGCGQAFAGLCIRAAEAWRTTRFL